MTTMFGEWWNDYCAMNTGRMIDSRQIALYAYTAGIAHARANDAQAPTAAPETDNVALALLGLKSRVDALETRIEVAQKTAQEAKQHYLDFAGNWNAAWSSFGKTL